MALQGQCMSLATMGEVISILLSGASSVNRFLSFGDDLAASISPI